MENTKKRKAISLETKFKILNEVKKGDKKKNVAELYGIIWKIKSVASQ